MSRRPVIAVLVSASLLILGSGGCTPKPRAEPSGFLGDYSEFQPDPDGSGTLRYARPGADLSLYTRVIIDPVVVSLSPKAADRAVNPQDLAALADYLRRALIAAMQDVYPVVEEPDDGVLRLRVALTDVIPTRPALNTAGTLLVAARLASAAKRAITGTDLFVGEVEIEAEVVDSRTNERLMAVVDRKAGDKFSLKQGATTWGDVKKSFREWAVGFRMTLDRAHRTR